MSDFADGYAGDWLPHKKTCRCTDCQLERAQQENAALTAERDAARKTAEYWKAEHLAGNVEIAALKARAIRLAELASDVVPLLKSIHECLPSLKALVRHAKQPAPSSAATDDQP